MKRKESNEKIVGFLDDYSEKALISLIRQNNNRARIAYAYSEAVKLNPRSTNIDKIFRRSGRVTTIMEEMPGDNMKVLIDVLKEGTINDILEDKKVTVRVLDFIKKVELSIKGVIIGEDEKEYVVVAQTEQVTENDKGETIDVVRGFRTIEEAERYIEENAEGELFYTAMTYKDFLDYDTGKVKARHHKRIGEAKDELPEKNREAIKALKRKIETYQEDEPIEDDSFGMETVDQIKDRKRRKIEEYRKAIERISSTSFTTPIKEEESE